MTIERILPNDRSETEHFNAERIRHGLLPLRPIHHVTKIRAGLGVACGPNCVIELVVYGYGFTELHGDGCEITGMAGKLTSCRVSARGQACASLRDEGGSGIRGVMVLDGLFPHESPKS